MSAENSRFDLWLTQIFGTANPKIHKVIENYGSSRQAYDAITAGDSSMISEQESENMDYITIDKTDRILDFCEKNSISLCNLGDPDYPKLLSEIYDPPLVFFYRGSLSCFDSLCLTFVGTRQPSKYIMKLCSRISKDVGSVGITLVSGMAHGVDECVHTACVANGLKTAGVLACGIDVDYPYGSRQLREKMVNYGGAYITEYIPGTKPAPENFNPRNRILAGLSRGTAVFQAAVNSGALITAGYALEENRDIFCVPPPDVFDPAYDGVIELIRDGAIPIFNHNDILKEYIGLYL